MRRHVALAVTAVVIAVAAVGGVIIATQGGGTTQGGETAESGVKLRLTCQALPSSIRSNCKNDPKQQWMVAPDAARAQADCSNPNYLTYGLFPSPAKAQEWTDSAGDGDARAAGGARRAR